MPEQSILPLPREIKEMASMNRSLANSRLLRRYCSKDNGGDDEHQRRRHS
jgi:hypothetical protein